MANDDRDDDDDVDERLDSLFDEPTPAPQAAPVETIDDVSAPEPSDSVEAIVALEDDASTEPSVANRTVPPPPPPPPTPKPKPAPDVRPADVAATRGSPAASVEPDLLSLSGEFRAAGRIVTAPTTGSHPATPSEATRSRERVLLVSLVVLLAGSNSYLLYTRGDGARVEPTPPVTTRSTTAASAPAREPPADTIPPAPGPIPNAPPVPEPELHAIGASAPTVDDTPISGGPEPDEDDDEVAIVDELPPVVRKTTPRPAHDGAAPKAAPKPKPKPKPEPEPEPDAAVPMERKPDPPQADAPSSETATPDASKTGASKPSSPEPDPSKPSATKPDATPAPSAGPKPDPPPFSP